MTCVSEPSPRWREPVTVNAAPRPHWVGNGFRVHGMFSHLAEEQRTDPFLMLDYAAPHDYQPNFQKPRGVGQHPHKGFETVTIAYEGAVAHRDSSGGGGVIERGDVQWMTAGAGVIHDEFHADHFSQQGGTFEMVQLWVNLPARHKLTPPRYQHLAAADIPQIALHDQAGNTTGQIRVIAGEWLEPNHQITGLANTFTPINLWDITVNAGCSMSLQIPGSHHLLLLIRHGEVQINAQGQPVGAAQLVTFGSGQAGSGNDRIQLTALSEQPAQLLLLSGEPINEPIAAHGPFVMNTREEIQQAIQEFQAGKFGRL